MNILLAANESAGIQALQLINNSGHRVTGVITETYSSNGAATVASVAEQMGLTVYPASTVESSVFAKNIVQDETDILLNIYLLRLIDKEILGSVNIGAFNLHPGPLPRYAGINTPSWAIYNQEDEYAVTLHWMTPALDEGPIAFEESFPVSDNETGLSLYIKCVNEGLQLLEKLLNICENDPDAIPVIMQPKKNRRIYKRNEKPNCGFINWAESASKIDAQVRACNFAPFQSPMDHPLTFLNGQEVEIVRTALSHIATNETEGKISKIENRVAVSCADEWLFIDQIGSNGSIISSHTLLKNGSRFETNGREYPNPAINFSQ